MDLRTGKSCWPEQHVLTIPHENLPTEHGIVIIGAGICGALIGARLNAAGEDPLFIDTRAPSFGSTAANTGILDYELDIPLFRLRETLGSSVAELVYRRAFEALPELRHLASAADPSFERLPCLYIPTDTQGIKSLESELAARARIGVPSMLISKQEIAARYSLVAPAALLTEESAAIDAAALAARLHREHNSRIAGGVTVLQLQEVGGCVHILLSTGQQLRARSVIVAGGYEGVIHLPNWRRQVSILSTYAIATER